MKANRNMSCLFHRWAINKAVAIYKNIAGIKKARTRFFAIGSGNFAVDDTE